MAALIQYSLGYLYNLDYNIVTLIQLRMDASHLIAPDYDLVMLLVFVRKEHWSVYLTIQLRLG